MKSQLQLLLNLSLAKKEESNFTTFTPYYLVSPLVYLQIFGKVSLGYIWKFAWFICQCISISHSVLLLLIRATVVCFMFYLFSQYMCEVLQRICTLLGSASPAFRQRPCLLSHSNPRIRGMCSRRVALSRWPGACQSHGSAQKATCLV